MNEKTLELLCEKLNTTVEYLIPKAQAYGIWTSVCGITFCVLTVASTIWFIVHLRKRYGEEWDWKMEDWEGTMCVVGGVMSLLAIVVALCLIPYMIMWITAPELGLLKLMK